MEISGRQIRGARGLLGWSQQKLADIAIVSLTSLKGAESEKSDVRTSTVSAIRKALEDAGVEFISPSGGKGEGIRMSRMD